MRILMAMGSILLLSVSAAGAQTTITFDPAPDGDTRIDNYSEGGMIFRADPFPGSTINDDTLGVPSNGSAFILKCGVCQPLLRPVDGGSFDLLSLDLGEPLFFGFGPFATAVTVTGLLEDGSTVSAEIVTDGALGFETVEVDLFDLVSATISTPSPYAALAIDNIAVSVGLDKPDLIVSPPSGAYVTAQAFDLTLIVVGSSSPSAVVASATLDGEDFMDALSGCAIVGSLDSIPGATFRCVLDASDLGAGPHTFEASIEVGGGMTATDVAIWEILENSE